MSKVQHSDALEARARKIVEALDGTWSRSRGMCCCPAHPDRTPSLSITLGKRAILVHCFAGCTNEAVIQAMARLCTRHPWRLGAASNCSTGRRCNRHTAIARKAE